MIIIPVYNVIILPNTRIFLQMDKLEGINDSELKIGSKVLFLVSKIEEKTSILEIDNFYPVGVVGVIREINKNGFIRVDTNERVTIEDFHYEGSHIQFGLVKREEINDLDLDVEHVKLTKLKASLNKLISKFQWGILIKNLVLDWKSISEVICAMSMWLSITNEERYSLLEEDSISKRTEMIEKILYEYIEIEQINNEATLHQEEDHKKVYREVAIKKQMDYLQKELDELHPESISDIAKFEKKINDSYMNDEAKKEATKILNRIKQESDHSPEYGMLYDYLDFITGLSWKKEKFSNIDLVKSEKILNKEHYGLKKVKKRIIEQIAIMNLKKKVTGTILLFVGPPGTGKTSIGESIAHALNRKYVRVSLGGIKDEADIRGHRRTYIGAMPGRIMNGISKCGVNNPVMVLDEIDKLSSSYQGDPASALLEVLDPEQNNTFTDHYLNVPYDLSDVVFICTANSIETIPEPLLNRMEVIEFNGYSPIEKFHIAKEYLLKKSYENIGVSKKNLKITDGALKRLIRDYTMESGVRGLKRTLDALCRQVAVELVKEKDVLLEVTARTVDNYLEQRPIHHDQVTALKKPGVVTGLAWTKLGGEILFIETLFTKGKGNIIITGRLGDVMKESVQIAISLVKSMFPEKSKLFSTNDIHIHVPEGAVPKDGPSAGITLVTAISSLVMNKKVDPHIAMTGEVSLRGNVMPIGGLNEKLMAAERAGITKVFIPKENIFDLKDIPKEVKDKLEIVPVSDVYEVLKQTKILH